MRIQSPLDALLPQIRQRLLAAVLLHAERWWYLSDLAQRLGVRPSSLQRELAALTAAGVLERRRDGNRVYYRAAGECPFLPELTGLLVKTSGIVAVLRTALSPLQTRIDVAFVYGSMARGDYRSASDVDLFVVGRLGLAELAKPLQRAEKQIGRAVNPTLYSRHELARRHRLGHHFIQSVLNEAKLFVVGSVDDLEAIVGERPRPSSRHQQERN